MKPIEEIVDSYWENGYNCATCTAAGVLTAYHDPDIDKILQMLRGFDNSDHGNTLCGAVLGIYLSMSKILENYGLSDKELKLRLRQFRKEFVSNFKSINCQTILRHFSEARPDECSSNTIEDCNQLVIESTLIALTILNWDTNPLIPIERRFAMI